MNMEELVQAEHALRQEQVEHLKAQARQYKESSSRSKAEAQAKRIKNCDGSSQSRLRIWMREIRLTIPYSDKTVYIASLTSEGHLRLELEKFLAAQNNREAVTWDELETHIRATFLTAHENERLRDALEKVKRNSYETTMAYGRRFSEAADLAYPHNARNADQQKTMLRLYMKGLDNEKLVLRLVQEKRPENYIEAIEEVNKYEADNYIVYRALHGEAPPDADSREEEPMDISAFQQTSPKKQEETAVSKSLTQQLTDLDRKVTGLAREFTKLKAVDRPPKREAASKPPPRTAFRGTRGGMQQRTSFKFTSDGRPICAKCNRPGHMRVDCGNNNSSSRPRPPFSAERRSQQGGGY